MEAFSSLTLEITTHCQANCVICVRDQIKYKLGNMTQDLFTKAVVETDNLYKKYGGGVKCVELGGMGEPLLDAQIEEKLRWLHGYNPNIQVVITTNGQLLKIKKEMICKYIDTIKISNYGFTKESYESVHRGSLKFEDVKSSIEEFLSIPKKDRPKTIMSFLILKENVGEENAWQQYWEEKCDELYIWLPHNWAGYRESHTKQNHEICRSCGRPGKDFVVRANGDISVCCFDFNREMSIGNLNEDSFENIYEGDKLRQIIEMHKHKDFFNHKNICQNCDQLYDRLDARVYSSNVNLKVGI